MLLPVTHIPRNRKIFPKEEPLRKDRFSPVFRLPSEKLAI